MYAARAAHTLLAVTPNRSSAMSQPTSHLATAGVPAPAPAAVRRQGFVFPAVREIVPRPAPVAGAPAADPLERRRQAHARERQRVVASLLAAPAAYRRA
jgi:hypothetical protein